MESSRIPDDHDVFRAIVYPIAFRSNKSFNHSKTFKLTLKEDGSFLGSLVWGKYAPTTECIHCYGCRLAARMEGKERRIYCGCYHLKVGAIRGLVNQPFLEAVLSADVVHHVENGEIAHADLRILVRPGHQNDEGTKTAILVRLWDSCRGPLRHKCECDQDVTPHPNSALEKAPLGSHTE
jgi:hypothetical protein